jgi:protein-L-isoaspartate O-methyltransferase
MTDDDALWSAFLSYIESAQAAQNPAVLFGGFRDEMIAEGMSEERVTDSIRSVMAMATVRRDWMAPMFDRIYAFGEPGFSVQPNALLVETVSSRAPGTALDIAMGQGRNALYLASRAWDVTGFDVSREGIAAAQSAAAERGLKIHALVSAHDDFEYGSSNWDLIVMTYALVPVTDISFASTLVEALRPGGLIVTESFATDPKRPPRPVEIDPDRLRQAYSPLRILKFETRKDVADWSDEPEVVVRMSAVKD